MLGIRDLWARLREPVKIIQIKTNEPLMPCNGQISVEIMLSGTGWLQIDGKRNFVYSGGKWFFLAKPGSNLEIVFRSLTYRDEKNFAVPENKTPIPDFTPAIERQSFRETFNHHRCQAAVYVQESVPKAFSQVPMLPKTQSDWHREDGTIVMGDMDPVHIVSDDPDFLARASRSLVSQFLSIETK